MTCKRYQKLTKYLDVSDRSDEPVQNSANYDKLYKICPVHTMAKDSFPKSYRSGKNNTIDEGIIDFNGRPS